MVQGSGWIAPDPEPMVQGGGWITPNLVAVGSARRILLVGLIAAPVLAFGTMEVIGHAWAACGDAEPPYLFSLLFGFLPVMTVVTWVAWAAGPVVAAGRGPTGMFLASALLGVLVSWGAIAVSVPMNDPSYYANATTPGNEIPEFDPAACRLDGVPTWWPSWLPI